MTKEDTDDWIIDENGFYVATRSFLIRRGSCCANQCRNCPYINWRNAPTWQPLAAEEIQVMAVSSKAIEGARKALASHQQQVKPEGQAQEGYHLAMIRHYQTLLERWELFNEEDRL